MRSIYEFTKGDIITRVDPSAILAYTEQYPHGLRDRSYIGDKFIFVGIANGCAYLNRTEGIDKKILGETLDLPLDIFSDGWDYYVDPKNLLEDVDDIIPLSALEKALERAIEKEDYKAAQNLKNRIEKKRE